MSDPSNDRNKIATITFNGEDITAELRAFASFLGLEQAAPGRYSRLLLFDLMAGYAARVLNPANVVCEIRALEGAGRSMTKPPLRFKYPPLKDLWHKHYVASGLGAMARNLRNGVAKDGLPWLEERLRNTQDVLSDLTEGDKDAIVDDAAIGTWCRRAGASELTGEWLIYARHEDANYYLCLGTHDGNHERLHRAIMSFCPLEFPFLATTV